MGVLKDFEQRLEGAVEGFFARAFGSDLQPVELAKALQRYADDNKLIAEDGPVVPNAYRVSIAPQDHERLSTYGDALQDELAEMLERTAAERGWRLRGPARVEVLADDSQKAGTYEVVGKVEVGERPDPQAPSQPARTPSTAPPSSSLLHPGGRHSPEVLRGPGGDHELTGSRMTVGRDPSCDIVLTDATVSREHAALVRRADAWWVLDLGSTNGTRVDGVQAAEQPLRDGATVAFGEAELTFDRGR